MSTEHTPGPWKALPEECDRPYIRIRGTVLGGRYKVANVLTPVYEGGPSHGAEETRANAKLIAAAPDLSAFAELVARMTTDQEMDGGMSGDDAVSTLSELIETARTLRNKAKGLT